MKWFSMTQVCFTADRTPEDPEKTILPALLFVNSNHPAFEDIRRPGFMLCLGWWDYSLKFCVFF